ncbi:MAG: hypothetical protein A3B23_03675 [Candidatus Colwellbacteria bacterium RIFCSPLOWO2_01_FULL_48_10]|uniref:Uncharacterized protein n=2 Tax=Bacteria candidate phyla TaxID=1783234 RepID=A0A1F5P275_9BACT|nr:MAG: hypothetical protein A2846_04240 [Candidatus Doudnabacteria bacterium RIFCSPHIGHO2_01_FULL_49_9]OGY59290.1 MAG: hypothetical protein A3B23_03675 [Candidatus Colwellbacteria bacterium RIFCSPLOWO2_01_FULL_48_10]
MEQTPQPADKKAENTSRFGLSAMKVLALIILTVTSAGFAGYFIINPSVGYGIFSIVLFWTFFALQVIFVKGWNRILPALAAESLLMTSPVVVAQSEVSSSLVFAWALLFLSLLSGQMSGMSKLKDSIKVPFWKVTRIALVNVISGAGLFAAMIYIFVIGPSGQAFTHFENALNAAVINPAVKIVAPDFSGGKTIDDIVTAIVRRGLESQDAFALIPAAQKDAAVTAASGVLKASLEDKLGPIDFSLSPARAIYKSVTDWIGGFSPSDKFYSGLIIVLVLWLLVKSLAIVLYIPVALVVFLVYETLIVTNLVALEYEVRSQETISLT